MSSDRSIRALVIVAVAASCFAAAFTVVKLLGSRDAAAPAEQVSGAISQDGVGGGSGVERLHPEGPGEARAADVRTVQSIGSKATLAREDVDQLIAFAERTATDDQLIVARNALVIGAERLVKSEMPDAERARIERLLISSLSSPVWRMRLSALSAIESAELASRVEVVDAVTRLRSDSQEKVKRRAAAFVLPGEGRLRTGEGSQSPAAPGP